MAVGTSTGTAIPATAAAVPQSGGSPSFSVVPPRPLGPPVKPPAAGPAPAPGIFDSLLSTLQNLWTAHPVAVVVIVIVILFLAGSGGGGKKGWF